MRSSTAASRGLSKSSAGGFEDLDLRFLFISNRILQSPSDYGQTRRLDYNQPHRIFRLVQTHIKLDITIIYNIHFESLSRLRWNERNALRAATARITNSSDDHDVRESASGATVAWCSGIRVFLVFVRAILNGSGVSELVGNRH